MRLKTRFSDFLCLISQKHYSIDFEYNTLRFREKLSSSVPASEHSSDNSDLSANLAGLEAELSRKEREINHLSTEFSAASEKSQVIVAQLNRQLEGFFICC